MEISNYKTKKISDINIFYNSQINNERQKYSRESLNIRKNFLISQFQKSTMLKQAANKLNAVIEFLQKEMNNAINIIKILKPNKIKNGNKRALLVGINYEDTYAQLNGCINDISLMENYLKTKDFSDITLLTDKTDIKPTKENILSSLDKFLSSSKDEDILYFHFSGHGSIVKDINGDEQDGRDETIVSKDLILITDDELISLIKQKLNKNTTLIAVFDSCHSGTVLDLKYTFTDNLEIIENTKYDETPNIIMISGCKDSQYSEEKYIYDKTYGLLTWSIYETVTKNKNLSWRSLYTSVKKLLKDSKAVQTPQLSMGSLIDIGDINNIF